MPTGFAQLLEKYSFVSIHHLNLLKLAIEMFKIKSELSPTIVVELLDQRINNYNSFCRLVSPYFVCVHHRTSLT